MKQLWWTLLLSGLIVQNGINLSMMMTMMTSSGGWSNVDLPRRLQQEDNHETIERKPLEIDVQIDESKELARQSGGQDGISKRLITRHPKPLEKEKQLEDNTMGVEQARRDSVTHLDATVFWNVYFPPADKGQEARDNAWRIIQEQVAQMHQYGVQRLHYITLGDTLDPDRHQHICQKFAECIHANHEPVGMEEVTQLQVWNHCRARRDDTIVYLHNKGSLHFKETNEYWRRYLTEAALTCRMNDECNVCGLQWFAMWTHFVPGNMMMAKCDYVSQLINPLEFPAHLEKVSIDLLISKLHKTSVSSSALENGDRVDFFGLGRYSAEHWMGSHPSVKGCDLDARAFTRLWVKEGNKLDPQASAPRRYGAPYHDTDISTHPMKQPESYRKRDVYGLRGQLYKWHQLYNATPGEDSPFWNWYPDGKEWKQLVQTVGVSQAIDQMTKPYKLKTPRVLDPESKPFNQTKSPADNDRTWFVDLVNVSQTPVMSVKDRYMTRTHIQESTPCKTKPEKCFHVGHHTLTYKGESLEALYDFCNEQPASRKVGYWWLTSDQDVSSTLSICDDEKFNWCGSKHHWISTCGYIQKLVRPSEFVELWQTNVLRKVVLLDIYTNLVIRNKASSILGVDGWALEKWISSHPSWNPDPRPNYRPYFKEEEMRHRDFGLLAGRILGWQGIYNATPSNASWVWKYYPDGSEWLDEVTNSGPNAVLTHTSRYTQRF